MATAGEELANVNFSRYSSAIFVVAQKEVWRAFHWLYHHCHEPGLYVGDYLRNTTGMSWLGNWEKEALARREDPAKMDIPLLYRLLQHVCGLAEENNNFAWNKVPTESKHQRLEHWLYQIKAIRHVLCHKPQNFMHMTNAELNSHLEKLMGLLCNIIREAGQRSKQPAEKVTNALDSIKERIIEIRLYNPSSVIHPQEFALLAKREMAEHLQGCTTWVKDPFATLQSQQGLEVQGETVTVQSSSGGEVTGMRLSSDEWLLYDTQLTEKVELELVVVVECREVFTRDLRRLLMEKLLPKTCWRCRPEEVLNLLGSLRVLWVMEGFEATAEARDLLSQLMMKLCSDSHMVLFRGQQDLLDEAGVTLPRVNTQDQGITGIMQLFLSNLMNNILSARTTMSTSNLIPVTHSGYESDGPRKKHWLLLI